MKGVGLAESAAVILAAVLFSALAVDLVPRGEGTRLAAAEELAEKSGLKKAGIASFAIDRARICRANGDMERCRSVVRRLRRRKDLTDDQKSELEAEERCR